MNGGFQMKEFYKKRFALTDKGARNLSKATMASFFVYCTNMLPAILLMIFAQEVLENMGQSITEYTQRKRMNVAETLLLNTELPIKEIAESVGYSSASKFSIYYKGYKGKLPSEVRNLACKHLNLKCDYCD